jgi:predicted DNA-binding protein (MmcQ/YjbR family)
VTPPEAFAAVQTYCLGKEGAVEEYPWEDVAWKVRGKMFACGSKDNSKFSVKSTLEKQSALVQHPHIEVAPYVGRYGWVMIDVVDQDTLELACELVDESYDAVQRKKKR